MAIQQNIKNVLNAPFTIAEDNKLVGDRGTISASGMNTEDTIKAVNALNYPEAKNEAMVYQVFEDGEVTLQKGGSLLWQRTLHCVSPGITHRALPARSLVNHMKSTPHSYIFARNERDAMTARNLIFNREGE